MPLLALEIISGKRHNETWSLSAQDIASEDRRTGVPNPPRKGSEIVELYLSIQEAVTSLLQLSSIIRKKPQVDEYIKAESKFPDMDPWIDINHVSDRYPKSKDGNLWLKNRLGTAITRRRQYLLYRKEHQEIMEAGSAKSIGMDGKTIKSRGDATTYFSMDQAREIFEASENKPVITIENEDLRTVYADSTFGKDGASDLLRTPLLPKNTDGRRVEYGEHFECPYCRRIIVVSDKQHWK